MATPPAIAVAPNVFRIPTVGAASVNSYAVLDDDGSVTLVDSGLHKAAPKIVAGLAAIGKRPSDVQRIVLTHAHLDHAGGAAEMARRTGAPLAIHQDDAQYLEAGQHPPTDPSTLGGRLFARTDQTFPPATAGERLTDGQVLAAGGGLRVVATPGHSPGHISLLHETTGTLITGDAIFNVLGLRYSPKLVCNDFRLSRRSAHVLGELEYDRVAFTHGPEIRTGGREVLRRFLSRNTAGIPE
jgi:glyoxylase-like metal-dependent hydrolase (beta-lactamase superfamily II)